MNRATLGDLETFLTAHRLQLRVRFDPEAGKDDGKSGQWIGELFSKSALAFAPTTPETFVYCDSMMEAIEAVIEHWQARCGGAS